jgi:phosphoglycerol transferase MdoB-like AlkP superfamily enzyme
MSATQVIRFFPPTVRFLLWAVGLNLLVFSAFRLAFWFAFRSNAIEAPADDLLLSFYLGLKFDLRLLLLACLPLLALAIIPFFNPARHLWARRLWLGYFVALQIVALLLYAVDFGHYGYVHARLNASIVEHLLPVSVAAQMAWETYPVVWGLLLTAVFAALWYALLKRFALPELDRDATPLKRWPKYGLVLALVAIYALGIFGKWSWYPLRWSDAYFSTNDFVAALALNPILYLADTFDNRSRDFDVELVREHYPLVSSLLGVEHPDAQKLNFARYVRPATPAPRPLNLIVIHLESFAGFKAGIFGNSLNATPNFDALARQGILFTNFFVPAVPTARSVFTMLTGIPDYNPGRAASRNPLVVNQHTLVNALSGHERYYFLGGSATWGNVRGILRRNVENLQMYEEGDYEAERLDTWGISDLALFEKALEILKQPTKPFFAFIQTAGNHRPFTLPSPLPPGFELAQADDVSLKANGFDSLAALNGLRFFDHALGEFFRRARAEPYFRDTVFVMYGDHGNPSASPTPWQQLELTSFHVPMLIFAPGLVQEGRRIDATASLVDLLPTSLSLMRVPYRNTTLGRDLLALRPASEHFTLIPEGIINDEFLWRLAPDGKQRLYRYRSAAPTEDIREKHPEIAATLARQREALFQTSLYLLHHNPPQTHRESSP